MSDKHEHEHEDITCMYDLLEMLEAVIESADPAK